MFVAFSHCMREVALNIKYLYEAIHTYTSVHDYYFSFNNMIIFTFYHGLTYTCQRPVDLRLGKSSKHN